MSEVVRGRLLSSAKIHKVFECWQQECPQPQGELVYASHYELLVAVILSAQATDVAVNKACSTLFLVANTPETMLDLGEEGLKKYIRQIGLYNNKAKNIIAMSQVLLERFSSAVPSSFTELCALPGVGRKTANVVLQMAFAQPVIAVDTHVFRVARRLGLSNGNTPDRVEDDLMRCVPQSYRYYAHHSQNSGTSLDTLGLFAIVTQQPLV